jgi:hypothetical protein
MSFALLTAMGGLDPPPDFPLNNAGGGDDGPEAARKSGATAALATASASPGETLAFSGLVGSALHLMGVDNFFHLVREGLGSVLLLAEALPSSAPILVPNTAAFRRALALLPPDCALDRTRVVLVPAAVTSVTAGAFAVADWRPPTAPPGTRQSTDRLFSMEFSAEQSASVFLHVRHAIRGQEESGEVEGEEGINDAQDGGGGAEEEDEEVDEDDEGGEEEEDEGEELYDGAVSADGEPSVQPQPSSQLVLYVSRSDSHVRRVPFEADLLHALVAALDAHARSEGRGVKYRVEGVTLTGEKRPRSATMQPVTDPLHDLSDMLRCFSRFLRAWF